MENRLISIFTPTHNPQWLHDIYICLRVQLHSSNWEWIVLTNGCTYSNSDPRVKIIEYSKESINNVGLLKKVACSHATGDILVELDHDDIITLDCLSKLNKAYDDPEVGFVYSNSVNVNVDEERSWTPMIWDTRYGWSYRVKELFGKEVIEAVSAKPFPQSISRIWFAPNHVRSWRKKAYDEIGGHDPEMKVSDGHDLICRTYLSKWKMHHIDECLYIYRVHGNNTWLKNSDDIQITMWQNYDRYIVPMMQKWSKENGLVCAEIGSGPVHKEGWHTFDHKKGADWKCDLNNEWPIASDSVGLLVANDVIEHLKSPIHVMNEAYRVLAHGGMFCINVPSTDGRGAFQDPTHVSFWNQNSFWYYTRAEQNNFIKDLCPVRFQTIKLVTYFPNKWCQNNNIPYVQAHLVCLKEGERFYGDIEI